MSTQSENIGPLTRFMDNIWAQLVVTTGITVLWLIWIFFEIIVREGGA